MTPDERSPAVLDVDKTDRTFISEARCTSGLPEWRLLVTASRKAFHGGWNDLVDEVEDFSQQYFRWEVRLNQETYMSSFCSLNFFLVGAFRRVGFMYVYLQSHLGLNFPFHRIRLLAPKAKTTLNPKPES